MFSRLGIERERGRAKEREKNDDGGSGEICVSGGDTEAFRSRESLLSRVRFHSAPLRRRLRRPPFANRSRSIWFLAGGGDSEPRVAWLHRAQEPNAQLSPTQRRCCAWGHRATPPGTSLAQVFTS